MNKADIKKIVSGIILLIVFDTLKAQTNSITPTEPVGVRLPTNTTVDVPSIVNTKFSSDYPNISPLWEMEADNYMASYNDPKTNTGRIVVYDRFGNIVHKDMEVDDTVYPPSIVNYYTTNFPREKYKIWLSEDNLGTKTYYSKRASGTTWFDRNGRYIKEQPEKSVTRKK